MALPTVPAETKLIKHYTGLAAARGKLIMMEVTRIESEYNTDQPADDDKLVTININLEPGATAAALNDPRVLWRRSLALDITTGGAMIEWTKTDDLTSDGKGEIWPAHDLFFVVDTDVGTELMSAHVAGYGFLVEMSPMEALVWLRERDRGTLT